MYPRTPFNKNNDDVHIVRSGWTTPSHTPTATLISHSLLKNIFIPQSATYPFTNEIKVEEVGYPAMMGNDTRICYLQ